MLGKHILRLRLVTLDISAVFRWSGGPCEWVLT
jgi:hypothetical protein